MTEDALLSYLGSHKQYFQQQKQLEVDLRFGMIILILIQEHLPLVWDFGQSTRELVLNENVNGFIQSFYSS